LPELTAATPDLIREIGMTQYLTLVNQGRLIGSALRGMLQG
jgi:hypothetical protein